MSLKKGMCIEACLSLLNQLGEGCSDDRKNSDTDFPISSEKEILEQCTDTTGKEIDPDYSAEEFVCASGNPQDPHETIANS